MLLVGMFDSPYVRRVAVSMRTLGLPFEHANWSVGRDQARIAELNPLGQVPVLVLDDGEVLVDSNAILDHLDQVVGPERALVPPRGDARRRVLHLATLAAGIADKARLQVYEHVFRPPERAHEPLRLRLRAQMLAACVQVDQACAARRDASWLVGDAMTQADITLACAFTFALESVGLPVEEAALPSLRAHHAKLEQLPAFREIYVPFDAPVVG
ncbi:MAG TPA: glutathione S-transferase family protein [Kofleriaceae bacterium]|nr:glutathione S-transferase family protein [Kofleriaceae bacterium]